MRSTIRLRESVDSKARDSILKAAMFWFVKVFKDFIVGATKYRSDVKHHLSNRKR